MNRKYYNNTDIDKILQLKNNPWRPVFMYGIMGFLWISFSDRILSILITNHIIYSQVQTFKGWLFIVITSFLLYLFIRMDNRLIFNLSSELNRTNEKLKEQQSLVKEIYRQSNAAIMIWSVEGKIIEVNDYFTELFGYTFEELKDINWIEVMVPEEQQYDVLKSIQLLKDKKRVFNIDGDIITKSGQLLHITWNDALLDSEHNNYQLVASYGFDITKERQQAKEIYNLAYVDTLTGLDNSAVFEKDIANLKENSIPFTVFLIDVDNFKHLNEIHGHQYGDEFLIQYGKKIKSSLIHLRVYRWSGDQFIVLEETTNTQAIQLTLENIQSLSHRSWHLNGIGFDSSVSIGVTTYPHDSGDLSNVYRNAEIALYAAKDKGKATYQYYSVNMLKEIEYVNFVEIELNKAIEMDHLTLYFQPIYFLKGNKIVSYEVLLRWFNDDLKDTNIGKVIEIAEKTEQIIEIDKWVIKNTFKLLNTHKSQLSNHSFSINISAQSFVSDNFIEYLIDQVDFHQIPAEKIQLEITEHSIIQDLAYSAKSMKKLKSLGFKLALDDFGTRYSSLNYLSKLPFDTLKLDKSYIDYLLLDSNDHAIIESMIHLSQKLNLNVVAEGIEEQGQYDELINIGCSHGQGYLMSRPFGIKELLV